MTFYPPSFVKYTYEGLQLYDVVDIRYESIIVNGHYVKTLLDFTVYAINMH